MDEAITRSAGSLRSARAVGAGALLALAIASCSKPASPPIDPFKNQCLSEWWIQERTACGAECVHQGPSTCAPRECKGALVVRSLSPDGIRVDVPVDLSMDGRLVPRLGDALLVAFRLEVSPDQKGDMVVIAGGERQTVRCQAWANPPLIEGVQRDPVPRELQPELFGWNRARLANSGLDAFGQPLPKQ
jgi:hypothetical protein